MKKITLLLALLVLLVTVNAQTIKMNGYEIEVRHVMPSTPGPYSDELYYYPKETRPDSVLLSGPYHLIMQSLKIRGYGMRGPNIVVQVQSLEFQNMPDRGEVLYVKTSQTNFKTRSSHSLGWYFQYDKTTDRFKEVE